MAIERSKHVRKSFFSLNSFGMKPVGVNPFIESFLYITPHSLVFIKKKLGDFI